MKLEPTLKRSARFVKRAEEAMCEAGLAETKSDRDFWLAEASADRREAEEAESGEGTGIDE